MEQSTRVCLNVLFLENLIQDGTLTETIIFHLILKTRSTTTQSVMQGKERDKISRLQFSEKKILKYLNFFYYDNPFWTTFKTQKIYVYRRVSRRARQQWNVINAQYTYKFLKTFLKKVSNWKSVVNDVCTTRTCFVKIFEKKFCDILIFDFTTLGSDIGCGAFKGPKKKITFMGKCENTRKKTLKLKVRR